MKTYLVKKISGHKIAIGSSIELPMASLFYRSGCPSPISSKRSDPISLFDNGRSGLFTHNNGIVIVVTPLS